MEDINDDFGVSAKYEDGGFCFEFELNLYNAAEKISVEECKEIALRYWLGLGYELAESDSGVLSLRRLNSVKKSSSFALSIEKSVRIECGANADKMKFFGRISALCTSRENKYSQLSVEKYSLENSDINVREFQHLILKFRQVLISSSTRNAYFNRKSNYLLEEAVVIFVILILLSSIGFSSFWTNINNESSTSASAVSEIKLDGVPSPKALMNREGLADVYLMPFYGFDESLAARLAMKLSEDLHLNVRITTVLPIPQQSIDINREQYICEAFYEPVLKARCRLADTKPETVCIALVNGSIFSSNAPLRFMFSTNFEGGVSIVGNFEVSEFGNANQSLYHTRLYKILKRTIGKSYYRYPPSSDKNSVMYSPLMSVYDLDLIGTEYK